MICIKAEIPQAICEIDDELKAIYHSSDSVCIWIFGTREDRNKFMDETAGMLKAEREQAFRSVLLLASAHRPLLSGPELCGDPMSKDFERLRI